MRQTTLRIIAFVLLLFRIVQPLECGKETEVKIDSTLYRGCEVSSWKGGSFRAFLGIPYAAAPIGRLRFKDPIALEDRGSSFIDARKDGKDCPSIFTDNASEDCLYLNVYTKQTTTILPVVVFIHPGGFYGGSGASTFIGPEYLLDKDIVLVTFNYRLGSLGFLNLGTPEVPGNAGLKDQVMALRWVRDNIHHFGGDSSNVSLMGYSAGALSVSLHLVSPMSQGLFHRAIIMSGSIPPQTRIPVGSQIELARKQARIMGCKDNEDIVECLNKYSGLEIAKTLRQMFPFGKDNPIFLWLPVIEESFGQERFMIEDPYVSLREGRFSKVPILIGYTSGEFCTSAQEIIVDDFLLGRFNTEFESLAPICFMYKDHEQENKISTAIQAHYFGNNSIDDDWFDELCNVFSDSLIRFGASKLAELASKHVNVYPYKFTYIGRICNLNYKKRNAVEHMDDLMYLFRMPLAKFSTEDPEARVVELMTDCFTKFIKNGIPDEKFEFKMGKYVEINTEVVVRDGSHFENYFFWNNITSSTLKNVSDAKKDALKTS